MNQHFATHKYNLMPASLDNIILENRDEIQLRLSNVKEIDALAKHVDAVFPITDEMINWRLISLIDKKAKEVKVLLAGDSATKHQPGVTSPIVAIDFDTEVAYTRSGSAYKLGNRGHGEPPKSNLLCIGAAMHAWKTSRESESPLQFQ